MRPIDGDALKIALDTFATLVGFRGLYDRGQVMECIDAAPTVVRDINVLGKWISVKDRLPDDTRFVLVCNDDKIIMVAQYIDETAQWQYPYIAYDVDIWDDDEQGPIMWWMSLPEPPKEVTGDE